MENLTKNSNYFYYPRSYQTNDVPKPFELAVRENFSEASKQPEKNTNCRKSAFSNLTKEQIAEFKDYLLNRKSIEKPRLQELSAKYKLYEEKFWALYKNNRAREKIELGTRKGKPLSIKRQLQPPNKISDNLDIITLQSRSNASERPINSSSKECKQNEVTIENVQPQHQDGKTPVPFTPSSSSDKSFYLMNMSNNTGIPNALSYQHNIDMANAYASLNMHFLYNYQLLYREIDSNLYQNSQNSLKYDQYKYFSQSPIQFQEFFLPTRPISTVRLYPYS
ncbi:UNVERIFIED_CONTAM: hypothetical protein RMT77_017711 [Armadillidium vulgare]|nr:hypothetical protein Avbf_08987 [Armadillidium vulgare]